ncbi:response regulator [Spirosoma flavus]
MAKNTTHRRRKSRQFPILIIEDNADQWLIIRSALLQCFPEVEPIWVNNAPHAMNYLETNAADPEKLPRIVLSDLYLPRREDGLALLDFIRNHTFYRKPPVVMLSSSEDVVDINHVYAFSVASYIIKPKTYHEWLTTFYGFRRYWMEIVTLPSLVH